MASLLTPPLLDLGRSLGLKEAPVALSVAMAAGQVFFPYQCAPFMLAYSFRRLNMGQLVLAMVCIAHQVPHIGNVYNLVYLVPPCL